jgi:hypothetical protein
MELGRRLRMSDTDKDVLKAILEKIDSLEAVIVGLSERQLSVEMRFKEMEDKVDILIQMLGE